MKEQLGQVAQALAEPPLPNQELVEELAQETAGLGPEERLKHDIAAEELIGELNEREALLAVYEAAVRRTRGEKDQGRDRADVDFSKIDWIARSDAGKVNAPTYSAQGITYKLADLTGFNPATDRAADRLKKQSVPGESDMLTKLAYTLTTTSLPQLDMRVRSSRGLRMLTRHGGRGGIDVAQTDYPCYKIDLQGTNNRALVLILNGGEVFTYGLAAIFDHDDDRDIYRAISRKR